MAACSLFEEDIVYVHKKSKGVHFGMVLENSELLSSSDEDDLDYHDDRIQKGTVRVAWYPNGRESVVSENKVKLADRSLMPGDVIRRLIPGRESQSGFILDMDVRCHLHIKKTNKYIYNINSKDLEPLQKFESGQDVVLDYWLGKVICVNTFVILRFPDGARCRAEESDVVNFDDISESRERHGEFSVGLFYEGQELQGTLDNLADAEWLHSTRHFCAKTVKKKGHVNVTVTIDKVITESVDVQWVFKRFDTDDPNIEVNPPRTLVEGEQLKKLKVLDWFEHCSISIADRKMYRIKNDDHIATLEPSHVFEPESLTSKDFAFPALANCDNVLVVASNNEAASDQVSISEGPVATGATTEGPETIRAPSEGPETTRVTSEHLEITRDSEDIEYEDDSDENEDDEDRLGDSLAKAAGGIRSSKRKKKSSYKPIGSRSKPGRQGPKQGPGNKKKSPKERTIAADSLVEVEVELTNSWATVMWQDGSVEKDIASCDLFPVHHLDELEFFPGDFVQAQTDLDIQPDYGAVVSCNHEERTCLIDWFKAFDGVKEKEPTLLQSNAEASVYDIKDHPIFKFRPGQTVVLISNVDPQNTTKTNLRSVGQIVKFSASGQLVVQWSDGTISQCFPQEIYMLSEEDEDTSDEESWDGDSESGGSSASWETESEEEIIGEEEIEEKDKKLSNTISEQKQELNSLLSRAQSALVRLQTLLNSFDVSISAPECFHDIIRIYRSCHDVDKILRSSFFSDPELQNLISKAKQEVKRDKANKISKHLNTLLESWGKSTTDTSAVRVGTSFSSGNMLHLAMTVSNKSDDVGMTSVEADKSESGDALGGTSCPANSTETLGSDGASINACNGMTSARALRKEYSEPMISGIHKESSASFQSRRPSDPALQAEPDARQAANPSQVPNMVGENCVGKATKRSKSDCLDYGQQDPKKSRDEAGCANQSAQELCYKICENLQKQIYKIYEEVNKRTSRLISSEESEKGASYVVDDPANSSGNPTDTEGSSMHSECVHGDVSALQDKQNEQEKKPILENGSGVEPCTEAMRQEEGQEEAMSASSVVASLEDGQELSIPEEEEEVVDDDHIIPSKGFVMSEEVGTFHKFISQQYQPSNPRAFNTAVRKELRLLQSSLPDGIFVKGFQDRLDLYSVMILGPADTPYEDAVFLFDLMLPKDYPTSPPLCHYHSFCSERLNPNLYEDGKVCVSLLGTWSGKGSEMWTSKSNMLQVLLSIQGLILVSEPYYNEAGYERQRGTQVGKENSRVYNEMAVLKTVQSLTRMCHKLPTAFEDDIRTHLGKYGPRIIRRLRKWLSMGKSVKASPGEGGSSHVDKPMGDQDKSQDTPTNSQEQEMESQVTDQLHHLQMNGKVSSEDSDDLAAVNNVDLANPKDEMAPKSEGPDFSLFPLSKGFCLALQKSLDSFETGLKLIEKS